MKTMIALLFAALSFTSQAALNQDDVLKALVGQWSVKMDSGDVKFLVRSNGDVQIISNAHREYVSAKLSFNSSTCVYFPRSQISKGLMISISAMGYAPFICFSTKGAISSGATM